MITSSGRSRAPASVWCLQQPKPMTEGTAELMYLVAGLSLLLCLGLCVLASMRFSRQLFEPIRALNSAMREVEEGNLNVQLDNRRYRRDGPALRSVSTGWPSACGRI